MKGEAAPEKKKVNQVRADQGHSTGKKLRQMIFLLIVIPVVILAGGMAAYRLQAEDMIRIGVSTGLMLLLLAFTIGCSFIRHDFSFDNEQHLLRFLGVFDFLLVVCCFFRMLPRTGWPFLFFAVILALFSNTVIGVISLCTLLQFACMLTGSEMNLFMTYLISGVGAIVLFSTLDEKYRIELPVILSALLYVTAMCANLLITQNDHPGYEMFIIPGISLFLYLMLLLMLLWYVNIRIVNREKNKFLEFNDPEYRLMTEIKSTDTAAYYRAIHTAYLCNKIAARLNMDCDMVRAAGFYHDCGIVLGGNTREHMQRVLSEYQFPDQVCEILTEYKSGQRIRRKETAVLMMSAAVIDGITYLFSQNPEVKINYMEMITGIFQKTMDRHIFDQCNMTISEMNYMKKMLMEETLYYDFLR